MYSKSAHPLKGWRLYIYRLLHITERPTREEERRAWLRKGEELERQRMGVIRSTWPTSGRSQRPLVLMPPPQPSLQEHVRAAFEKRSAHSQPGELLKLVNESMRAATQPALPVFLQLPIPTTLRESGSIVPEPEQQQTGSDDAWEANEELATQSEPLATMETPAGEEPVVIVKEQADRHAHPQMPEDEQQAVAEVSSNALPGTHQETTTEDMLAITVKQQTMPPAVMHSHAQDSEAETKPCPENEQEAQSPAEEPASQPAKEEQEPQPL